MPRRVLFFGVVNTAIIGTLVYLFRTGELSGKNLPLVGLICFLSMNGLVFLMLHRRRK